MGGDQNKALYKNITNFIYQIEGIMQKLRPAFNRSASYKGLKPSAVEVNKGPDQYLWKYGPVNPAALILYTVDVGVQRTATKTKLVTQEKVFISS